MDSGKRQTGQTETSYWTAEVDVPENYKSTMINFLKIRRDIFAAKDSELGHTDTVKIKLDTGDNPPSELRPYRTPVHNIHLTEKAIDEMLDANIIYRSVPM